jgi:hypothetical protein
VVSGTPEYSFVPARLATAVIGCAGGSTGAGTVIPLDVGGGKQAATEAGVCTDGAKGIGAVTTSPFGIAGDAVPIGLGGGAYWSDVRLRSMLGRGHEEDAGGTPALSRGPTITGLSS